MDITTTEGRIAGVAADAIILDFFEGETVRGELAEIDKALDGAISFLVGQKEIKGKADEVTVIHSLGKLPARRVAVLGLGKRNDMTLDRVRGAVAKALRVLRQKGAQDIATGLLAAGALNAGAERAARALVEGAVLGLYTFRKHVTKEPEFGEVKHLAIVTPDRSEIPAVQDGIRKGAIVSEAVNLARDMVNEPSNYLTPTVMAETAHRLAREHGLEVTVLEREQMRELGMGGLLGVAQGSQQPPKFIILSYWGAGNRDPDLVLAGKGITFDSGGISIKPSEGMGDMKGDMAGGAAVMAALSAVAQLKLRINVTALVPATENLPSGSALKPGDILTAITRKTIEIISTDAEGRLILADALGYANRLGAKRIVDVATLTGACRIALGEHCSGGFTNSQALLDSVVAAGAEAGERIWQLPMYEEYREQIKSDVADVKNTGGRWAGAITAAQFLAEFVGETPWVHLDIAGTDMTDKERGYLVKGATGVMVRTLANLAISLAAERK